MPRVLIAMSGGIDSSVAAMLLLEQGYELVGVTFRTFDSIKESCLAREKGCCSVESIMEAKHLAEQLGFEHHILDYRQIFRDTVIRNFVDEYMHGRTPNPCVLCNSHIKWGELLRAADTYGCDMIATGHYARIAKRGGHTYLRNAVDTRKDQTYFLWMLTEQNLDRTIFPLGGLEKTEVRQRAADYGFERLSKKSESQEICFVPDNDYRSFLQSEGCEMCKGEFVDKEGKVLGLHEGYQNYTIGQRKGLGIALGTPAYVTRIDASDNKVVLGSHDDLLTSRVVAHDLRVRDEQWLMSDRSVKVRIRYRSPQVEAMVDEIDSENHTIAITTKEPVWGVTPGQSLVIYKDDLLVGGGVISYELKS